MASRSYQSVAYIQNRCMSFRAVWPAKPHESRLTFDPDTRETVDKAARQKVADRSESQRAGEARFIARCEAYLDSKGFLRSPSSATAMSASI